MSNFNINLSSLQKKDKYYIDLVCQIRQGSKCLRAIYGSLILSKDERIVGTGYNGKPKHSCNDGICYRENLAPNSAKDNCCLHSEANCILFTAPLDRLEGTMYVSGIPCQDCTLLILQSGVKRLVYLDSSEPLTGHKGSSNISYWERYGIPLEVTPFTYKQYEKLFSPNS